MSRLYLPICALCVLLFFAFGCAGQNSKNALRKVSDPYNKHINRPAVLELDTKEYLEPYQITLSRSITDIDYLLEQLTRAMDDSDRSPDEEWVNYMLKTFPWLGGIAIVDAKGSVLVRVPEFTLKPFKVEPLLAEIPGQRRTELRTYIMPSPMGPEIYVAKPVYIQDELQALIVAHFDIRSLLAIAGEPENFMLLTPETLLWSGVYNIIETPLHDANWEELGKKSVNGTLENVNGEFYWLQTYFANISLFYALPVKGEFTINRSQLGVLKTADSFTAIKNLR